MRHGDHLKVAILKVLSELGESAGAVRIAQQLGLNGVTVRPRTVRHYLLQLDKEGLTELVARRHGRRITERGRDELAHANIMKKVGFVATRIDELVFRMDFDLEARQGSVIANIAMIPETYLSRALEDMRPVFARGWGMSSLMAVAKAGERLGDYLVPSDTAAIATICSVTVNGILLKKGIPVTSRFGGLLEVRNDKPLRFLELIDYRGTTLDPIEVFIQARMMRVREAARTGNGIIGASFREVPSVALEVLNRLRRKMQSAGLGGIIGVGYPNQALFDIPVSEGRTGLVVVGGLNPIAAIREAGGPATIHSLATLVDFERFDSFARIRNRFPAI